MIERKTLRGYVFTLSGFVECDPNRPDTMDRQAEAWRRVNELGKKLFREAGLKHISAKRSWHPRFTENGETPDEKDEGRSILDRLMNPDMSEKPQPSETPAGADDGAGGAHT